MKPTDCLEAQQPPRGICPPGVKFRWQHKPLDERLETEPAPRTPSASPRQELCKALWPHDHSQGPGTVLAQPCLGTEREWPGATGCRHRHCQRPVPPPSAAALASWTVTGEFQQPQILPLTKQSLSSLRCWVLNLAPNSGKLVRWPHRPQHSGLQGCCCFSHSPWAVLTPRSPLLTHPGPPGHPPLKVCCFAGEGGGGKQDPSRSTQVHPSRAVTRTPELLLVTTGPVGNLRPPSHTTSVLWAEGSFPIIQP